MELDIEKICEALERPEFEKANRFDKNPGNGVSYKIDGDNCVSSVSFWPNGYCDIEFIEGGKEAVINHYEFITYQEALETITSEVRQAINRA